MTDLNLVDRINRMALACGNKEVHLEEACDYTGFSSPCKFIHLLSHFGDKK